MRILALQLKRIGDLVLTTPALATLKAILGANLTLAVDQGTAGLLPAIPNIDAAIVFGRGRGWAPWQQVLTGQYDAVYDFTGTDRSASATALSRADSRTTFQWVKKKRLRSLAYNCFVESSVRERHTVDHYLDLTTASVPIQATDGAPRLQVAQETREAGPYAILHPGTARPEKFWLADRWVELARHLIEKHGLRVIITTGPADLERGHAARIQSAIRKPESAVATPANLCAFATLLAHAAVVVSVDTAAVHLAAAFRRPQIALFGPTNPFHWRPRHDGAVVISASQADTPMVDFSPRMKGASMDRIPVSTVIQAIDTVLPLSA
ncbi:MAG TPA: glycosyltransferase family 9 protein [Chthoniobacteraceae bacterium]|jgi:ADP-heptose:LPS heptosyltransferase|nr:glycosyltransferase family 9 protein [Chthoniobacteraceae bacterium]